MGHALSSRADPTASRGPQPDARDSAGGTGAHAAADYGAEHTASGAGPARSGAHRDSGGARAPAPPPASASASPGRHQTSGPAVLVGFGYQTPFLGGEIDYSWIPPGSPIGVTGCVGVGWIPSTDIDMSVAQTDPAVGLAFGAMGFFGRRHRGFLDVTYGAAVISAQAIGNLVLRQETLYGLTGAAGYEFVGSYGFVFRVSVGATRVFGDAPPGQSKTIPTLNLALGYKIF
jgi:hypothetical protein